MSWCVLPMMPASRDVHVLPLDELRHHELDVGCWCGARRDREARRVIVHRDREGRATT